MKILVMSDSHGRRDLVEKCIRQNSSAKVVIHLGDMVSDIENMQFDFPDRTFINVRGNCDWQTETPASQCITLDGVTIFLTHGHTQGVKYGLDTLISIARQNEAQICLYGHTHVPYNKYHDGLYVMNPGSLAYPRDSSRPGFGLIDIVPRGIVTNIVDFDIY